MLGKKRKSERSYWSSKLLLKSNFQGLVQCQGEVIRDTIIRTTHLPRKVKTTKSIQTLVKSTSRSAQMTWWRWMIDSLISNLKQTGTMSVQTWWKVKKACKVKSLIRKLGDLSNRIQISQVLLNQGIRFQHGWLLTSETIYQRRPLQRLSPDYHMHHRVGSTLDSRLARLKTWTTSHQILMTNLTQEIAYDS